jgi:hypothetical protein
MIDERIQDNLNTLGEYVNELDKLEHFIGEEVNPLEIIKVLNLSKTGNCIIL